MTPEIGKWYMDRDKNEFEVVALDDKNETIGIQYFNGNLDEIEVDHWSLREFSEIAAPEDWSGPFDEMEKDDLGFENSLAPGGYQPLERVDWDEGNDLFDVD